MPEKIAKYMVFVCPTHVVTFVLKCLRHFMYTIFLPANYSDSLYSYIGCIPDWHLHWKYMYTMRGYMDKMNKDIQGLSPR